MKSKWQQQASNMTLESEDKKFFLSYNPDPSKASDPILKLADQLGQALGLDLRAGEETALVLYGEPRNTYSILKGDFREAYEKLLPFGYEACLAFYESQKKEHGSDWSTEVGERIVDELK